MPIFAVPRIGKPIQWKPLRGPRRAWCAFLLLLGLSTLWAPSISLEREVLGRTQWSPLQILSGIHSGRLPVTHFLGNMPWWADGAALPILVSYAALWLCFGSVVIGSSPAVVFSLLTVDLLAACSLGKLNWVFYGPGDPLFFKLDAVNNLHYLLMMGAIDALILGVLYLNQTDFRPARNARQDHSRP
jgi:hypothetical protein